MNRSTNIVAIASLLAAAHAFAEPTWLGGAPSVPDYYQHQLANQARAETPSPLPRATHAAPGAANYRQDRFWWEDGAGWCGTTAWVNALGYWDENGYRGLIDRTARGGVHAGKNWLEQYTYSNSELALTAGAGGSCAWVDDVRSYVRANTVSDARPGGIDPTINRYMWARNAANTGWEVQTITSPEGTEYNRNSDLTGTGTTLYNTMFNILCNSIPQGWTAVIKIGESPNPGPNRTGNNDNWWGNFHVLTLAGIEGFNILLADPNNSNRGAGWGVPDVAGDGRPVGAAHYQRYGIAPDGMTLVGGAYDGSKIEQVYLMKVPAPGAAALAGIGAILALKRRRT